MSIRFMITSREHSDYSFVTSDLAAPRAPARSDRRDARQILLSSALPVPTTSSAGR